LSSIVLDASAGVEIAFQSPVGRQLQAKIPAGSTTWVPEHYFVEVTGVLRRAEVNRRHTEAQVRVALDRLLAAPVRRVSVRPLISEAWLLRHNMTVADALYVVVAKHLRADLVTTHLKLANSPTLPVSTITP
jgi:predicted nucleic acid-binding protein